MIDESVDMVDKVIGERLGVMGGLWFYGKRERKEKGDEVFGMGMEIEYVGLEEVKNMVKELGKGVEVWGRLVVRWGKGVEV